MLNKKHYSEQDCQWGLQNQNDQHANYANQPDRIAESRTHLARGRGKTWQHISRYC